MEFIDLKTQYSRIQKSINSRINTVLEHGKFIMGPEVGELEEKLASYVNVRHCIGVASGTDALLIAMMALDIGNGDEVITTPFTFIATAEMIRLIGAKPVFVDIDPRTYNINPDLIESAITPRTRAIIAVNLYGQCADYDEINKIASKHGIPVIEDAAQSFGATYKEHSSCALSNIGCTSFFPSKPLGCYGDGGACFTNDDALARRMREIRIHGQSKRYHHTTIGINGRLDTIQAAVLLAKLEIFPEEIELRKKIGAQYTESLNTAFPQKEKASGIEHICTPYIESYNTSVYAQYTLQVKDRELLQSTLEQKGIPTAIHYPVPLHHQPAFSDMDIPNQGYPVAEQVCQHVISIPMHPYLSQEDQLQVVNVIKTCLIN